LMNSMRVTVQPVVPPLPTLVPTGVPSAAPSLSPTKDPTTGIDWSSNFSFVYTVPTLNLSHFDRSTANGSAIHDAFRETVASTAKVSPQEVALHVSQTSGRRADASGVQVEIQIARAPHPDFEALMIAPEGFSKQFVALAKTKGVEIEPPQLERQQIETNQGEGIEESANDSLVWPLVGGALGLLAMSGAVVGYLYFQKNQLVLQDKSHGSPRSLSVSECKDDGLTAEAIQEITNPLKSDLDAKVDQVMAAAAKSGIDLTDHAALAKFTELYTSATTTMETEARTGDCLTI